MNIRDNIEFVQEKIYSASKKSGRNSETIKLMAVSKLHNVEKIIEAYGCGINLFGENRVQEAVDKFRDISLLDLELHMIGNLQRNKVKKIVPIVSCIQSIDRIELLHEIAKQPQFNSVSLLLEVHTAEDSKSGFKTEQEIENAINIGIENNLSITGFMTMAPFTQDKRLIRKSFIDLRKMSEKMQSKFKGLHLHELSMGMSNDYEIAIEEGSTLVRIGSAIFANS